MVYADFFVILHAKKCEKMKLLLILSVLPAILAGEYNAKTLSIEEQDSILAVSSQPSDVSHVKLASDASTRYRLERENEEQIFRHSQVAEWFVYDTMRHTRKRLGEGMFKGEEVKVRDAVMSPNGRYVAFAKGNNLYVHKLDFGTEVAVTKGTCRSSVGRIIWRRSIPSWRACAIRKPVVPMRKRAFAFMTWRRKGL